MALLEAVVPFRSSAKESDSDERKSSNKSSKRGDGEKIVHFDQLNF